MSDAIIVALITLGGTIITIVATNRKAAADMDKRLELSDAQIRADLREHQAVTDTKIEELTREVREHNNFARRMPVLEEQIKAANHRIEDLERKTE